MATNMSAPAHLLVYERMQLDLRGELSRLLGFVGAASAAAPPAVHSALLKATSEGLDASLANFSRHELLFRGWPCLHEMLTAVQPRPFPDGCPALSATAAAALPEGMVRRAVHGEFPGVIAAAKAKAGQIACA